MSWIVKTDDGAVISPSGKEIGSIDGPPWMFDDVRTLATSWYRGLDNPDADDTADLQTALAGHIDTE